MKHQKNNIDSSADFQILENFERFDQKNDVFRRSWWDKTIRSKKKLNFFILPIGSH